MKKANILLTVVAGLVVAIVATAWTGPLSSPPTGGDDLAPINVGSVTQLKSGGLGVDGVLQVYGQAIFYDAENPGVPKVGIGLASPSYALDVNGVARLTGLVIPTGAGASKVLTSDATGIATWQDLPASDAVWTKDGSWNVSIASAPMTVSAGNNAAATGNYSTAMGLNTKAFAHNSFAAGSGTLAGDLALTDPTIGQYSVAIGSGAHARGTASVAMGASDALGSGSVAMGDSIAGGIGSVALGNTSHASGDYATAIGYGNVASATYSTALGLDSIASGLNSFAFGTSANAQASYSMAIGHMVRVEPAGTNSIVMGRGFSNGDPLNNAIPNSFMVGFLSNQATLFVGPASGVGTYGKVGIGTHTPAYNLDVAGTIRADEVIVTAAPVDSTDVANKGYVDSVVGGGGLLGITQVVDGVPAPGGGSVACPVGTLRVGGGNSWAASPIATYSYPSGTDSWTSVCAVGEMCAPSVVCLQ